MEIVRPTLKTYEEGAIRATFNTGSFFDLHAATITVTIDKPFPAEVQLHVKGVIRSDLMFTPGSVQFGDVDQGQQAKQSVSLSYLGRSDWQVVGVKSPNPNITATAVETGRQGGQVWYQLNVRLDPHLAAGYLNDQLIVETNDPQTPSVSLMVEGRVKPALTVSPSRCSWGLSTRVSRRPSRWLCGPANLSESSRWPVMTSRSGSARRKTPPPRPSTSSRSRFWQARISAR